MNDEVEPAVDQLVDEWLARLWALHEVAPELCATPDLAATVRLRRRASELMHDVDVGTVSCLDVLRLLHPVGPPDRHDAWWSTPIGRLVQGARGRRPRRADLAASNSACGRQRAVPA